MKNCPGQEAMDARRHVLDRLYRRKCIGGKHTGIEHVLSGCPRHRQKEIKSAINELITEGFVIAKNTSYGLQVSLEQSRLEEIRAILDN